MPANAFSPCLIAGGRAWVSWTPWPTLRRPRCLQQCGVACEIYWRTWFITLFPCHWPIPLAARVGQRARGQRARAGSLPAALCTLRSVLLSGLEPCVHRLLTTERLWAEFLAARGQVLPNALPFAPVSAGQIRVPYAEAEVGSTRVGRQCQRALCTSLPS